MESSAAYPVSILLFGEDFRLVETRQWVLEKSGFHLQTALNLKELQHKASNEQVHLFLLCDSLSSEARGYALSLIHSTWPDAKRLVLAPVSQLAEFAPQEEVFPAMEGPRKLVSAIRTLIVNGPVAAA